MSVAIVTAIADPRWESELTARLSQPGSGIEVVRRCVDLDDLVAAGAAGVARAVVLSADLRHLDRHAVDRLRAVNLAVVGLVGSGDDAAEQQLRQCGIPHVLTRDAASDVVVAAVMEAIAHGDEDRLASDPVVEPPPSAGGTAPRAGTGRVVAVWGPTGAPGRSTVAVNLAAELVDLGHPVMLVDADSYGGAVGQLLGIPDDAPGVAAACRLAAAGTLDAPRLAAAALEVVPRLRLLTGITRPDRWRELRPAALDVVIALARSLASYVVIDCAFCLETEDEVAAEPTVPRRNAATVTALSAADRIVGVAAADPIGLARYVRAVPGCLELASDARLITVVNRLRREVVGPGEPRRHVIAALDRYAGLTDVHVVPEDREALDRAIAAGRSLIEAAPKSPARLALRELAVRVAGGRSAGRSGRRRAG